MSGLHFEARGRVLENYDFQGLKIESISLNWAPYITLDRCNEQVSIFGSWWWSRGRWSWIEIDRPKVPLKEPAVLIWSG